MVQLEHYETLSKACYNCPHNVSDCYRPHCIAADGVRRTILTVNRMMPGPKIEVYFYKKCLRSYKFYSYHSYSGLFGRHCVCRCCKSFSG